MCDPDNCNCEQDFHRCSCSALNRVYYTKGGMEYWTNKEYKTVADFKRWYELEGQDYDLLDVVRLVDDE